MNPSLDVDRVDPGTDHKTEPRRCSLGKIAILSARWKSGGSSAAPVEIGGGA
jgi:hypothetical protein